jgi:thiamine-monophosphate kinase
MELAVSADMLVAGRHFLPDADPELLGHKSLAVNLSDMAAMGAKPMWATLALALPDANAPWLARFARGFMRLARRHAVDLIGGDTTRGPLTISVQIMGIVPVGRALRRDRAKRGDDVWVSGTLGDAALAVAAHEGRVEIDARGRAALERRLNAPTPRIELGVALRSVARSAIDISDGLVSDLGHICERSGVSAEIEFHSLPASRAVRLRRDSEAGHLALLAGGDDYELCFTAPAKLRAAVERAARSGRVKATRIGRIVAAERRGGTSVKVIDARGAVIELPRGGYDHFG